MRRRGKAGGPRSLLRSHLLGNLRSLKQEGEQNSGSQSTHFGYTLQHDKHFGCGTRTVDPKYGADRSSINLCEFRYNSDLHTTGQKSCNSICGLEVLVIGTTI